MRTKPPLWPVVAWVVLATAPAMGAKERRPAHEQRDHAVFKATKRRFIGNLKPEARGARVFLREVELRQVLTKGGKKKHHLLKVKLAALEAETEKVAKALIPGAAHLPQEVPDEAIRRQDVTVHYGDFSVVIDPKSNKVLEIRDLIHMRDTPREETLRRGAQEDHQRNEIIAAVEGQQTKLVPDVIRQHLTNRLTVARQEKSPLDGLEGIALRSTRFPKVQIGEPERLAPGIYQASVELTVAGQRRYAHYVVGVTGDSAASRGEVIHATALSDQESRLKVTTAAYPGLLLTTVPLGRGRWVYYGTTPVDTANYHPNGTRVGVGPAVVELLVHNQTMIRQPSPKDPKSSSAIAVRPAIHPDRAVGERWKREGWQVYNVYDGPRGRRLSVADLPRKRLTKKELDRPQSAGISGPNKQNKRETYGVSFLYQVAYHPVDGRLVKAEALSDPRTGEDFDITRLGPEQASWRRADKNLSPGPRLFEVLFGEFQPS